jgi:replicative DNA helicase
METSAQESNVAPLRDDETKGPLYRNAPQNAEIEAALLGAILTNNRAHEQVADFLRPEHFYQPAHQRVFAAVAKLIEMGQQASPATLRHYFEQDDELTAVGGAQYLMELATSVFSTINAGEYGQTVRDLYLRRGLITLGEHVVNEGYRPDIDISAMDQIETTEQSLYDLATTGETERGYIALVDAAKVAVEMAEQAIQHDGQVVGVATGLKDIDRLLGGLHPSDLLIVAGRPSMGKTALATNIAFNAAKSGNTILFFSLEMSSEQLATRILSEQSEIPSDRIRRGDIKDDEFQRVVVASQELHRTPLYIDDTPALTVSALRTRARRLKRQKQLDLIVVDYLQLMSSGLARRNDSRVQEISEITRGLKTLAKELNVPVLALSQLSRQVESRDNKRPQLADLRESGSIEQDADVVMFIFREEYYLEKDKPIRDYDEDNAHYAEKFEKWQIKKAEVENIAEVIVAKQRHGPTDSVNLHFNGTLTRFTDADHHHNPDDYP